MRKILYLITKGCSHFSEPLLSQDRNAEEDVSVILLQEGVACKEVVARKVYVLSEDLALKNLSSRHTPISYGDMLEKIFAADTVIAL
jgi:hypothetical protein